MSSGISGGAVIPSGISGGAIPSGIWGIVCSPLLASVVSSVPVKPCICIPPLPCPPIPPKPMPNMSVAVPLLALSPSSFGYMVVSPPAMVI